MATTDESIVCHRPTTHLLPLSPRVPSSTDRHFEQYLIDHHNFPKLPSITKSTTPRAIIENQDLNGFLPMIRERQTNSINRLLNSDQYRLSHARLIEYRQHSKIPGVTLTNTSNELSSTTRNDSILPLKEVFPETTKIKQQQNFDEIDFVDDDDSILSNETDRKRRAKHWIKEHQFFFTEYQ